MEFTDTRSGRIPRKMLGDERLSGVLVVDRYCGYNRVPVELQYCYAHLLRDVEELENEFSDNREVIGFTSAFIPLLAQAMKLRTLPIDDSDFYERADKLKAEIIGLARATTYQQNKGLRERRLRSIACT